MLLGQLTDIWDRAPRGRPLLGLDVGKKTVGLAVCDSGQSIATPLETLKRTKFAADAGAILKFMRDYEAGGLVLGWPLNLDGSHSRRCDAVRSFADELAKVPGIAACTDWMAFHDERLSTVSVEEMVGKAVNNRKAKESGLTDKLAAQVILQGALDTLARRRIA